MSHPASEIKFNQARRIAATTACRVSGVRACGGQPRLEGCPNFGNRSLIAHRQVPALLLKQHQFVAQSTYAVHIRVWLRRQLIEGGGVDRLQLGQVVPGTGERDCLILHPSWAQSFFVVWASSGLGLGLLIAIGHTRPSYVERPPVALRGGPNPQASSRRKNICRLPSMAGPLAGATCIRPNKPRLPSANARCPRLGGKGLSMQLPRS